MRAVTTIVLTTIFACSVHGFQLPGHCQGNSNNPARFTLSASSTVSNLDRPKTRQGRNKKFLLKRWKSQQQHQKELRKGELEQQTSQLISVVGVDPKTLHDRDEGHRNIAAPKIKPTNRRKPASNRATLDHGLLSWSLLQPGSQVTGTVVKVLAYGVLVQTGHDIPGKTPGCALLHQSQMLGRAFQVGQVVENARVLSLNRDKGTVSLTLQVPTKRAIVVNALQVGDQVQGKVVRFTAYGAFVDIGLPRNALLHKSRMSMYQVTNMTHHVGAIGSIVTVRILRMHQGDIAVSMLSKDNDAFVDRRDLQRQRRILWDTLVNSAPDEVTEARVKRELLEVDHQMWELFMALSAGPLTGEV